MDKFAAAKALLAVLYASRAPPLDALAAPQYLREFCAHEDENGIVLEVDKRGFRRYKRRWTPKDPPPPLDTEGIKTALNTALAPAGLHVQSVRDLGEYLKIILEELL